eukprot:4420-Heterococcus_DN1.PRE.1
MAQLQMVRIKMYITLCTINYERCVMHDRYLPYALSSSWLSSSLLLIPAQWCLASSGAKVLLGCSTIGASATAAAATGAAATGDSGTSAVNP